MRHSKAAEIKTEQGFFASLSEKLKAAATRPNILGYVPHDKQVIFHMSLAKAKLFIGGNRSGKTVGGATEAIWWLTHTHPYRKTPDGPIRGRCVSVDFANGVEKIVRPEIARWCPNSALLGGSWSTAWDKETRTLHFADGGFLEFMSYDQDLDKFAGTSRHFIWFDEEPPNSIFNECMMRLIDTGGSYWITMTPVEGMTWIYDTLYEPGKTGLDPDKLVVEVEMMMNPHINADEAEFILAGLTADERKAREKGQFVQIGGVIYKQWNPALHVIYDEDFVIPSNWLRFNAMDHGYNNPTSWGWYAVSPDGVIIKYDEHYDAGHLVGFHAEQVHRKNQEHGIIPAYNIGDPSIANTDPITGTSIQIEYMEYGIPIALANHDVKAGINRVGRFLEGIRATTPDGRVVQRPRFYVTSNCKMTLWEFPRYRWKTWATKKGQFQNNKKEEPHKKDDHAMDEVRYAIVSRPETDNGTFTPEFVIPVGHSTAVSSYSDRVDTDLISSGNREGTDFHFGSEF